MLRFSARSPMLSSTFIWAPRSRWPRRCLSFRRADEKPTRRATPSVLSSHRAAMMVGISAARKLAEQAYIRTVYETSPRAHTTDEGRASMGRRLLAVFHYALSRHEWLQVGDGSGGRSASICAGALLMARCRVSADARRCAQFSAA